MSFSPAPSGLGRIAAIGITFAALFGVGGVLLGAYAAHGAPDELKESMSFASLHALVHGLALFGTALVHDMIASSPFSRWCIRLAMLGFVLGVLMFSGSIFVQIFAIYTGLTAHGGTAFLAGWLLLTLGAGAQIFRRRGP
ncbi:MAG: DUF423 domain-containing protein [Alphaproteobacteria bacterium]|nr:DUF423 domain-containing protein [Alphaproteobacteria bacterium]